MDYHKFVTESNRIERILRPPTEGEVTATREFICSGLPTVESVSALALAYAPHKGVLRDQEGMDVRVGSHFPPRGASRIRGDLRVLLSEINDYNPFEFHVAYEMLHPFMDGNGRTGRALWAWQMAHDPAQLALLDLGFLHAFYYQTLSAQRKP